MTPRQCALDCLVRLRRDKRKAGDLLNERCGDLSPADAALAWALTMTVVQNQMYLDAVIAQVRPGKLEPLVRDILRLGAAQILFLRIPAHAAVFESVALAKQSIPRLAGLCNGVLRRLAEKTSQEWERILEPDISLKYSLPDWLLAEATLALPPEEVEAWAKASRTIPPVSALVHPDRELSEELEIHPLYSDMVIIRVPVTRLKSFQEGKLLIIDAGARMLVEAMGLLPGQSVWDCCASPGGKSCLCAFAVGKEGSVLATDISDAKVAKITQKARSLGLHWIQTRRKDARIRDTSELFDHVLCDVPCSGLGVISKKPDICMKDPAEFAHLPALQLSILTQAAKATKPGGSLLYSTCTFRESENREVVDAFLKANPDFSPHAFTLFGSSGPELRLWAHRPPNGAPAGCIDSFYCYRMKREDPNGSHEHDTSGTGSVDDRAK